MDKSGSGMADIIIIGAGGSGLCAAVAAAEAGANVLVLEKAKKPGGNSIFPRGGSFAVGSKYHKTKGLLFTVNDVFKSIMKYTHYRANAELLRAFLEKSADTVDWLEERGVQFLPIPDAYVKFTEYATGLPVQGTGKAVVGALVKKCSDLGVVIQTETIVLKIVKNNEGLIGGVTVKSPDGSESVLNCRAVIIATGGFGDNPDMVREHTGFELGKNMFTLYKKGMNGDGIRLAWEAGADRDGMGCQIIFGTVGTGFRSRSLPVLQQQPLLIVNKLGNRFMDESLPDPTFKGNAIARQPGGCAWLIFDAETKMGMEKGNFDVPHMFFPSERLKDFDQTVAELRGKGNENIFRAESLKDLADQTGIDFSALTKAVSRYNRLCEYKLDEDFGKKGIYLHAVRKSPFYALKIFPVMYGTIGGIRVNGKLEVLDNGHRPIPGLYAAGYDANGCLGAPVADYTMGTPGLTFGFALNSGRIAGESAAAWVAKA